MTTDENGHQALLWEMMAAASNGDLTQLQTLLQTWETQNIDLEGWFEPSVPEQFEILNQLNKPQQDTRLIQPNWYIFNRLLVTASRANQVAVVGFLLRRGTAITSSAVQQAMANDAFDVLEIFLENGWNINQPIRNNLCPILRLVPSPMK